MNSTSRVTRTLIGLGALVSVLAPASAGLAGSYPPDYDPPVPGILDPTIEVEPDPVVAGEQFTVTVRPCVKDTIIPITFNGTTVNALCTNPRAQATFRAPTKPGTYALSVKSYIKVKTVQITVVAGSGGSVPNTGASGIPLTLSIGASLLATGIGVYVVARRRLHMRLAG